MSSVVSDGRTSRLIPRWREWHPWLTATAFVANVTSRNAHCLSPVDLGTLLGLGLLIASGLYLLVWSLRRATPQAAVIATVVFVGLVLYGRTYDEFRKLGWITDPSLVHGVFLLTGVALVSVTWMSKGELPRLSTWLSLTMLLVAGQSATKIAQVYTAVLGDPSRVDTADIPLRDDAHTEQDRAEGRPDIYYLIFDGYGRADVLAQRYDHDNSPFLDGLRQRGFYIADKSCTNYPLTQYSLASSLNVNFLDNITPTAATRSFYEMIRAPKVARFLKQRGYRFIHFNSPWPGTSFSRTADQTIGPQRGLKDMFLIFHSFSALRFVVHHNMLAEYISVHRDAFEELPNIAKQAEPTFTFAHFIAPHPPFVFDREGRGREDIDQTKRQSYTDELIAMNAVVTRMVDRIVAQSATKPIIIVQADHGPAFFACAPLAPDNDAEWVQERLPILNAYLVPEQVRSKLYPTISPVNSFRLLLSECFGAALPLLPDRLYMTHYRAAWMVRDVTEQVPDGIPNTTIPVPPHDTVVVSEPN